jgi:hypothetical protein
MDYHLAQVNIALMHAPLTDPIMADFVANLGIINAAADRAPGFVWRLQTAEGDATALRVFDNDYLLINMSVWKSVEALFDYTYKSDHASVFRRRKEWFERMDAPTIALWWMPAGHLPTPDEAKLKLEHLQQHGATPLAFTFKQRFTAADMLEASQATNP